MNREQYEKRCGVIINLLKKEMPNLIFYIEKNKDICWDIILTDYELGFSINNNITFTEFMRIIRNRIEAGDEEDPHLCRICCVNEITSTISCPCSGIMCACCYIKLYRDGWCEVICPFCKRKDGNRTTHKEVVEYGVKQLQKRLDFTDNKYVY